MQNTLRLKFVALSFLAATTSEAARVDADAMGSSSHSVAAHAAGAAALAEDERAAPQATAKKDKRKKKRGDGASVARSHFTTGTALDPEVQLAEATALAETLGEELVAAQGTEEALRTELNAHKTFEATLLRLLKVKNQDDALDRVTTLCETSIKLGGRSPGKMAGEVAAHAAEISRLRAENETLRAAQTAAAAAASSRGRSASHGASNVDGAAVEKLMGQNRTLVVENSELNARNTALTTVAKDLYQSSQHYLAEAVRLREVGFFGTKKITPYDARLVTAATRASGKEEVDRLAQAHMPRVVIGSPEPSAGGVGAKRARRALDAAAAGAGSAAMDEDADPVPAAHAAGNGSASKRSRMGSGSEGARAASGAGASSRR